MTLSSITTLVLAKMIILTAAIRWKTMTVCTVISCEKKTTEKKKYIECRTKGKGSMTKTKEITLANH